MSKDKSKAAQKSKPATPAGKAVGPLPPGAPILSRKIELAILFVILLGAAVLRLADRDEAPPGLNQDEVVTAWNAWCLLKTGHDQAGVSWPIFYVRALGSNYTTVNMYLQMSLQAIGGLGVWTTRGPASLGGILTVFLIYFTGKRLLGTGGGLLAAGLLALNPWHLFTCRWGIDSNICPLLALAPLSLLLAARLPPMLTPGKPPCPVLAALAGVGTGLCFYGYPAILIFLPPFLIAIVAASWRQWWGLIRGEGVSPSRSEGISPSLASSSVSSSRKERITEEETRERDARETRGRDALATRRGLAAVLVFAITAGAVFAPLAWMHAFRGEEMHKRAAGQWIWEFDQPTGEHFSLGTKVEAVVGRYLDHFGADFLFLRGDHSSIESPPDMGMFHWYMLPLFLLGAVWCVKNFRSSPAARVILLWVLLYPAGDSLGWSFGDQRELCLHSLRSSPGICGLVLLAAAGGAWAGSWLLQRNRSIFWVATCGLALTVGGLNVRFLTTFFGEYNRRPFIFHRYHVDLIAACRWLKPRLDQYDAVFCTTDALWQFQRYVDPRTAYIPLEQIKQPYIIMLHELGYDPRKWLADPKDRSDPNALMFDLYYRFGKVFFLYPASVGPAGGSIRVVPQVLPALEELRKNGKPDRVLFILRPGEEKYFEGFQDLGLDQEPPAAEIPGPDGWGPSRAVLRLYEKTL